MIISPILNICGKGYGFGTIIISPNTERLVSSKIGIYRGRIVSIPTNFNPSSNTGRFQPLANNTMKFKIEPANISQRDLYRKLIIIPINNNIYEIIINCFKYLNILSKRCTSSIWFIETRKYCINIAIINNHIFLKLIFLNLDILPPLIRPMIKDNIINSINN